MHYDGTLRGRFVQPIMTDKITGKGIPVNKEMSPLDIQKLNEMYPCKQTASVCGKFWWECLTWFIFALDQASNQALKEEINRLNSEVENLNAESRSLNLTSTTRRIFMETKPTEQNPIPVSTPAKRPISTKTCRGNSKFFYEEMVFFEFLGNSIFIYWSFDRKLS